MKRFLIPIMSAILAIAGCAQDKYIASVEDLLLVRVDPGEGYEGAIVNVLGRNFSTSFGENKVVIGGKEAKIIEFTKDKITIIVPENELGTYPVEVTTPKGTVSSPSVTFTYKKRPEKMYTVTTVAGNGSNSLKDEIGTSAAIGQIEGLAFAPDGNLWFCQRSAGNAIRTFNPSTQMVKTVATPIPLPWGGDFDAAGNFFYSQKDAKAVGMIDAGTGANSTFATDASLNAPMYVKFDSKGDMWLASRGNNTVYRVHGNSVTETYTGEKYFPASLAIDSKDRVFFGSTQLRGIFMISGGEVTRIAGSGEKPTKDNFAASFTGNPLDLNIGYVGGIDFGPDGTLYYTDYLTFTVMMIVPDGDDYSKGKISILAGLPFTNAVTNGTTDKAAFKYPSGIAVSPDGKKIYVSEPTGYVLRVIDLS